MPDDDGNKDGNKCQSCGGSGADWDGSDCKACNGTGRN